MLLLSLFCTAFFWTRSCFIPLIHLLVASSLFVNSLTFLRCTCAGKKLLVVANVPAEEKFGYQSHGVLLLGQNWEESTLPRSFKEVFQYPGALPTGSSYTLVWMTVINSIAMLCIIVNSCCNVICHHSVDMKPRSPRLLLNSTHVSVPALFLCTVQHMINVVGNECY